MTDKPTYAELENRVQELEKILNNHKEKQFSQNEERLQAEDTKRRILEASIGGIYIFDLSLGRNIYTNKQYTALTGYTFDEISSMKGDEFFSLFHPEDRSQVLEHMHSITDNLPDGKNLHLDYRFKCSKGGWKWFRSCDAVYERDESGKVRQFIGTFIDVTEYKKSEVSLVENEELFRAVFEQTGGYCMLLKPTENGIPEIVDANEAACEAHGYTKEELIGRPVADLDDEEGKKQCRKNTEIILSGQTLAVENVHVRKDGSTFPVVVYANKVEFSDKQPLIVTTEFDITEKKSIEADKAELEKQLQQVKKMESIGQLAGGIAHDFNNILYPIIGFTQLSQDDLPYDHPVQENLKDILDGALRARDLVKRILFFSRQVEPKMEPKLLRPVFHETYKLLRSTIPANIDLVLDLYSGDDYVLCDSSEIHEILLNLCTNAYHAIIDEKGEIIISLKKQNPGHELNLPSGNYLCLSVQDDGVGIPEKFKAKIFEPYVTTKDVGKGSGLGLAVVYGLVQNYNGGISVDSSPGRGSIFKVFLPITEHQINLKDTAQTNKNQLIGNGERILFVDDESSIVKLGVRTLENRGYIVTGMENVSKALGVFESKPNEFDLVITDMAMPSMLGSEFAKKILDIRNDMPIIICSGYSEHLEIFRKEEGRVKTFLDKPLLTEDLVKKVGELLSSHYK